MPYLYCLVCVYYLNISVSSRLITSVGEEIGESSITRNGTVKN